VAQKSEDAAFVQTTKKDVAKAAGLSAPGVAVITNFEGRWWFSSLRRVRLVLCDQRALHK
jgi:hypothetical protein